MPPRKKSRQNDGAAAAAVGSTAAADAAAEPSLPPPTAAARRSGRAKDATATTATDLSDSASAAASAVPSAAAAASKRNGGRKSVAKRKATQQHANNSAVAEAEEDAASPAAAASKSAAAAVSSADECMPQAAAEADGADEEKSAAAAAASAAPKKITRKAQLAEAKRLKKAKLAAEDAEADSTAAAAADTPGADAMDDVEEEKLSGDAAASSAPVKKLTRKAQLAEAKRAKRAAEAAAAAEAIAAAQAEMLRPKPPAVDASRCPPPHGLHKDVLHALLESMHMADLAALIQLSRAWYGAVRSVPWSSLHAEQQEQFSVAVMCQSPLARQIGSLSIQSKRNRLGITDFELKLISTNMPNLHSLETKLLMKVSDVGPWHFPPALRKLVCSPYTAAALSEATVHSLLTAVASLHSLRHLDLFLSDTKKPVDLSPLAPIATQLEEFHGYCRFEVPSNVDLIRSMTNLRVLDCALDFQSESARLILAAPCPFLQLEEFRHPEHDRGYWERDRLDTSAFFRDEASDRFPLVPSLTKLQLTRIDCARFDFLCPLANLRTLALDFPHPHPGDPNILTHCRADVIMEALKSCAQLTEFGVSKARFTSADLSLLLARMPHLIRLTVARCPFVSDISFLSSVPLLRLLRVFVEWKFDVASLQPLSQLPQLTFLELGQASHPLWQIDPAVVRALRLPCALLPSLRYWAQVHTIYHQRQIEANEPWRWGAELLGL